MKSIVEQNFSTNSHLTTKHLKHSLNFESVENVRSSNVVEFEFEHRHISKTDVCNLTAQLLLSENKQEENKQQLVSRWVKL